MESAEVVSSFTDNGYACLAVRVMETRTTIDDKGKPHTATVGVESIGRVPMDAAWTAMTPAQRRTALLAAASAERERATGAGTAPTDLGFSGRVTLP